jgi:hypothetical protein
MHPNDAASSECLSPTTPIRESLTCAHYHSIELRAYVWTVFLNPRGAKVQKKDVGFTNSFIATALCA